MSKISCTELKSLLAAEKADALSAMSASKLSAERSDAMDYYFGHMNRDMPFADGRSRAVSTDVSDTMEGLRPQLVDIFCGSGEVVRFNPVGPREAAAADKQTDCSDQVCSTT